MDDITRWRKKIDDVDRQLVELLNERARIAVQLGRTKNRLQRRIYDPAREEVVIQNALASCNGGPMKPEAVRRIFERIIEESRAVQHKEPAFQVKGSRFKEGGLRSEF